MEFSRKFTGLAALSVAVFASVPASAKSDNIEKAGQAVAFALPLVAGGISAYDEDWTGMAQLAVSTGASVGTVYVLKHFIHEERPDGSDKKSFPSDTAALAFAPAQYLWQRYGWEYGVPAYLAAGFVGYSRVESKQHHWWDVAASAVISIGWNEIFTTRYHRNLDIYGGYDPGAKSAYFSLHYRF
jgi:membrane-associated phospholipid phosphatase